MSFLSGLLGPYVGVFLCRFKYRYVFLVGFFACPFIALVRSMFTEGIVSLVNRLISSRTLGQDLVLLCALNGLFGLVALFVVAAGKSQFSKKI